MPPHNKHMLVFTNISWITVCVQLKILDHQWKESTMRWQIPEITGGITPTPLERRLLSLPSKSRWFRHTHLRRVICYRISKTPNSWPKCFMIQPSIKSVATKWRRKIWPKLRLEKTTRNKNKFNEIHIESSDKRKKLLEIIREGSFVVAHHSFNERELLYCPVL